jgi:hypothetical protein
MAIAGEAGAEDACAMIAVSCNYDRKSATTVETDQKAQAEPA